MPTTRRATSPPTRSSTFSTGNTCGAPFTHAYQIQGTDEAPAITGSVTTEGVVVGDYEGAEPALRGFYLQDAGDGDAATSDGIFVFEGSDADSVELGDVVAGHRHRPRVPGTDADHRGHGARRRSAATGDVTPVDVTLPLPRRRRSSPTRACSSGCRRR